MSIEGRVLTALQAWGGPGPLTGSRSFLIVAVLEFPLQLAGPSSTRLDEPDAPLSFQTDNDGIRLVVQVLDEDGLPLDVRTLGSYRIRLLKPNGVSEDHAAALLTNGTDGKIFFDVQPGDAEESGLYRIQGLLGNDATLRTTRLGQFKVNDNIDAPGVS